MMNEYIYALERGSRKFLCPKCGKRKMVRYRNQETNEYLPFQFGRCDRVDNCGYHENPYKEGFNKEYLKEVSKRPIKQIIKTTVYIPLEILERTLKDYENNFFIQNLECYPRDQVNEILSLYYLGTVSSGYLKGAVTFPYIDRKQNVRAIQVRLFNSEQHGIATDYVHSMLERYYKENKLSIPSWLVEYKKNDKIVTCLFGEHLLNQYLENPIALVEAPKTAVYGALHFGTPDNTDDFLWLSVYNLSSLTYEKCKVLKGRTVVLFPDLSKNASAYKLWETQAKKFNKLLPNTRFIMSDFLERNATDKERLKGGDLADYLIQLNRSSALTLDSKNNINGYPCSWG
jgi:predicted RNA-binding Zn-ribbon protein involved in translation (DUF1610 family)